jgi:hypothetical protein
VCGVALQAQQVEATGDVSLRKRPFTNNAALEVVDPVTAADSLSARSGLDRARTVNADIGPSLYHSCPVVGTHIEIADRLGKNTAPSELSDWHTTVSEIHTITSVRIVSP